MGFACERIVPGRHLALALEQVPNVPRYPHRLVDDLRLEGEDSLHLVLDDGGAVVERNHETANIEEAWGQRNGVVT